MTTDDRVSGAEAGAMLRAANDAKNPGSAAAVSAGCTCPVLDNARGLGYMRQAGMFVITEGCPIHGALPKPEASSFLESLSTGVRRHERQASPSCPTAR